MKNIVKMKKLIKEYEKEIRENVTEGYRFISEGRAEWAKISLRFAGVFYTLLKVAGSQIANNPKYSYGISGLAEKLNNQLGEQNVA